MYTAQPTIKTHLRECLALMGVADVNCTDPICMLESIQERLLQWNGSKSSSPHHSEKIRSVDTEIQENLRACLALIVPAVTSVCSSTLCMVQRLLADLQDHGTELEATLAQFDAEAGWEHGLRPAETQ
jgi:hypothetical protein